MASTQVAGTKVLINLTLQDEALAAQDLAGATLTWRLTRDYAVPGVLNAIPVLDTPPGTDGLATVTLTPADTLDLQGTYYHEVKADYGSDNEKTWQLGTIIFNESSVGAD